MDKKVYEFIATQTGEKIEEWRTCPNCGQEFAITDKDLEFYKKISPVFNGTKYEIPAPTLCPDCRQQRRLAWRNERKLYKRKCDLTNKPMISMYSEDSKFKVYSLEAWWSDKWDPMDYGRGFDFSRSFFEQFGELLLDVPQVNLSVLNMENSDYNNQSWTMKNCYLMFNCNFDENCAYGKWVNYSNRAYDSYKCYGLQNTYECIDCHNSYKLFYSQQCVNCNESYFLYDCQNCKNCYGCKNINWKQYMFFNKQLTREEYYIKLSEYLKKPISDQRKETDNHFLKYPIRYIFDYNSANVAGDFITNSKNTLFVFDVDQVEDSKYVADCYESNNLMDVCYFGMNLSYSYYSTTVGIHSSKIYFSVDCWSNVSDIYYSVSCVNNCKNLFWCSGLKDKQYCILNKQYTKEEYQELLPKIIEHMKNTWERWEFLHPNISLFGYNETNGMEYYPMEKETALSKWYKRQDKEYPINVPEGIETVNAKDFPDNIHDVDDSILKKAVLCEITGKPFRIVAPELEFYRKHSLPLPKRHPDQRHLDRMTRRWGRQFYLRTCDNCGKQVVSVYSADSEFKVYCEECYNKETY